MFWPLKFFDETSQNFELNF